MIFGELYKRNNEWKFRAVGQGFNGGLGPLARSFGIDVADEAPAPRRPRPPHHHHLLPHRRRLPRHRRRPLRPPRPPPPPR
jgi:hypothetical protein